MRHIPDERNRHIQKPLQRLAQKAKTELGVDGVGVTFLLLCSDIVIVVSVVDISRSFKDAGYLKRCICPFCDLEKT